MIDMIKYMDNESVIGWYYETQEGFLYGDGTKKMALSIEKSHQEENIQEINHTRD